MGVSLLSMAWWGIVLTSIGSVIGAFLLVWGGVVLYSIIKNKMSKRKIEDETNFNPQDIDEEP